MTKNEWIAELARMEADEAQIEWVTAHPSDDPEEIWQSCRNVRWLIWFAARRSPRAIAAFARRCADRAAEYAADYTRVAGADRAASDAGTYAHRVCAAGTDRIATRVASTDLEYSAAYAAHVAGRAACYGSSGNVAPAHAAELASQLADLHDMWEEIV